jgi:hypothetical protein
VRHAYEFLNHTYKNVAKALVDFSFSFYLYVEFGVERKSFDKDELRETALVPADKFNFSPEINIYDNKVMIASWREKLGIIIESSEIADAMKKNL